MRYILFLFIFFICSSFLNIGSFVNAQTVTQPGLRDYQLSGAALPDSILYIMGTDTLDASKYQGLAKWYRADSLRNWFKDTDWLRYRTGVVPNNTDTMYHIGIATVGDDSTYTGKLNVIGRLDLRFPNFNSTNIAIGNTAGRTAMTGSYNIAMGVNSLDAATSGSDNVAIGRNALGAATTSGNNVAIGTGAASQIVAGSNNNFFMGSNSGIISEGDENVIIGASAGSGGTSGVSRNIFIGAYSGQNATGTNNVFIGHESGVINSGSSNVLIGFNAGYNLDASNMLYIENSDSDDPLLEGDFASDTLRINGALSIATVAAGASTDSVLVWTPSNGRVKMRNASAFGGSGDDWGSDVVNTDLTLTGDGTAGNVLKVDTSEIATQYDLTLISGGATDLTIGGSGPSYTIESSTGTDVTIAANAGISLFESPANTLLFNNDGVIAAENSSTGTTHVFDLVDNTASSLGTLTLTEGTGITLTTSGTLSNGIVTIASTVADTDDQNLTIEGSGPTYQIAINDGTDVTVSNVYGLTLSEPVANTLGLAVDTSKLATQYDISGFGTMSNWLLAASGTGGTETVTNGETVTFAETTGLDATRSTNTVSYALSIDEFITDGAPEGDELGLFYDPSGTNHELVDISELLNVVEEGNVTVQSDNMNLDFQTMFDVAADGAGEVNISLDLSEATTVTTVESDDYLIMHDAGSAQHQKILWSDIHSDVISFEEDNVAEGTGNTIDVGTGIDLSVTGTEADITLDFNEFTTDAATEGDEFVILYDPSAATQEKVAITSLSGGTDTNFAEDDLTFTGSRTHDMGANSLTLTGTATNVYIQEENGGTGNMLVLVSELGAGTGITGGISFQSENGGTPTEQYDLESYKWSTNQSTFKISGEQATDAEIIYEKNADLADNTTESHLAINGGIAFTQNYDGSTGGNDLSLDRSYYNVNITGGNVTDTIKLPEVAATTDNWSSSLSSTQCQVGQEYVISNLRSGVNLVIGAYNPAGTSDDLIGTRTAPGGSAGSAISIAPGKSVIVKCYQLAGGIGYWNYWLSN